MGIKKDINLKGDDYNWISSMFYFGNTSMKTFAPAKIDDTQAISHGNTQRTDSSNACP